MESRDQLPKDLPVFKTRHVLLILFVAGIGFVGLFLWGYLPDRAQHERLVEEAQQVADAPPVVATVVPRATQEDVELPLPGSAVAMQQTAIYARVNGYLKRRLVDIGDHVEAGQLLAEIDAPEVDAQLGEAQAALAQAQANVSSAKTNYDLAQATYVRYKGLVATGGVTEQDLDTHQTNMMQSDSALTAAEAAVRSSEATVQRLSALKGFEKVVAPFDGIIILRNYDPGALISPTDTAAGHEMFDVAETDIIRVFVNVPQSYAALIKMNDPATFVSPSSADQVFIGNVARWAGALDPATRTMNTELHFDNHNGLLYAGMYGRVTFKLHRDKPILTVPTSALLFEAEGTQVSVVRDGKVHFQKVTVGRDLGTEIEIQVGLTEDDEVIANPGERLTEGLAVQSGEQSPPAGKPAPTAAAAVKP
jgi:RND family efflux transporter MFP subunit